MSANKHEATITVTGAGQQTVGKIDTVVEGNTHRQVPLLKVWAL